MKDDLLDYLLATGELDEFLGYEEKQSLEDNNDELDEEESNEDDE